MNGLEQLERYDPSGYYDFKNQFARELYERSTAAFLSGEQAKDAIVNTEALKAYQARLRAFMLKSMGDLPEGSELFATVTGSFRQYGLTIENIVFQPRLRNYITANLYLPDDSTGAAVLFLCGHEKQAKHNDVYQRTCMLLTQAGLIVLAVDPIGQGERLGYCGEKEIWGSAEHDLSGNPCWLTGGAIARYFLHDAMRSIDYLCTRKEVDPAKIGVTGQSGGGTQTSLLMICDPRVAAAAPATFVTSRWEYMRAGGAQDAEQIWPGFTAAGFDHEDILIAMAPKPVLVLAAEYDFFPLEGALRTVERARRFWQMHGRSKDVELFVEATVHQYSEKMAKRAAEFFSLHLMGKHVSVTGAEMMPVEPRRLWCTKSGQVKMEYSGSQSVFEENNARLRHLEAVRRLICCNERKAAAINWLKQRVFANRKMENPNIRIFDHQKIGGMDVQFSFWRSRENMFHFSYLFRDAERRDCRLPAVVALWEGGTKSLATHEEWIRQTCENGFAVLVTDLTGDGNLMPYPVNGSEPDANYGAVYKLADDLMWLDDSLTAVRTYDVIRAVEALAVWPGVANGNCLIYAEGRFGVYARLAAALESGIEPLELKDGPGSFGKSNFHYAGLVGQRLYDEAHIMEIILPGALQWFDLSDLDCWRGA